MSNKTLIIIPTYNERENIEKIIKDVLGQDENLNVLIVDDSSPDGTGKLVETEAEKNNPKVFLLSREKKEGLGKAYLAGFEWALKHEYDFVISMDADFSHNPADIPRLLNVDSKVDLVIGSRYIKEGRVEGWDFKRLINSKGANFVTRLLLGLKPKDVTAGFKRYSKKLLKHLTLQKLESSGYAFQVETVAQAQNNGFSIQEIPIIFTDRRLGESKISGELWRSAKLVLKLASRRRGIRQFVKFGLVGAFNAVLDFGVLNILVLVFHFNVYLAGALSLTLALTSSFYWNRRFTFRSDSPRVAAEYVKFTIINGLGAFFNFLIYSALIHYLGFWYNLAKAIAVLITMFWNFLGSKYWVFRK